MFYLIFLWLLVLESTIDWKTIVDEKPKNRYIILASLICTIIPTIYVIAINFFGLDLTILKIGHDVFGIRSVTPTGDPWDFLELQWPISCEYIVLTVFFVVAVILAYKMKGLKAFSISFALLGGISAAYMLDTIIPYGIFRPLQELALPTASAATILFDFLGYAPQLSYPVYYAGSSLPSLAVTMGGKTVSVLIAWACAGVHSLLLYVLIIAVFFKKSSISAFRKLSYFIIGLFGTFFVNVLRIFSIVVITLNYGKDAGTVFHNTYGEIYFFTWIFLFILLIICIQRYMLVERTRYGMHKLRVTAPLVLHRLGSSSVTAIRKLSSYLKTKFRQLKAKLGR
jgi:thaumarchaeosortase